MPGRFPSSIGGALRRVVSLSSCIVLSLVLAGPTEVAAQAASNSTPAPSSFSTKGLHNEDACINIHRGKFVGVPFDREDMRFATLYSSYLKSYAGKCSAHLPSDKVEITRQECATERVTTNGWGVETNRYCVEWVSVGTGLYADPEMYQAKLELDRLQAGDAVRNALKLMDGNIFSNTMNLASEVQAIQSDMHALVQMNACDSPGLKRFQENLRLFALNKRPKRLAETEAASSVVKPSPGTSFEDQNYTRLLEDLIYDQSRSWLVNRFVRGSVSGVSVSSRDAQGRPSKIVTQYRYIGFNDQRSRGSVTLTFDGGWPECMYFFDNRATCRTPNRKIVAAYADGDYHRK